MDFGDFSTPSRYKEETEESGNFHHQQHYKQEDQSSQYSDQQTAAYYNANLSHQMSCDIKPRLTKEQHDILEAHYQKQNKPNTNTKKGFAESLNVSLDKVNNWFQNRRAKSKQDAKKQAGAYNLFHAQQAAGHINFSDSDTSPSFASSDYFSMMQESSSSDPSPNGLGICQFEEHGRNNGMAFQNGGPGGEDFFSQNMPQQAPSDLFDSPQDLNRRTLTQEQFDMFAQHNSFLQPGGVDFQNGMPHGDVLNQMFPELNGNALKQQEALAFSSASMEPLSSNDSTVPSNFSALSVSSFPSSTNMQDMGSVSSTSSDWTGSRSSSIAMTPSHKTEDPFAQVSAPQQHAATTSQWQPGQSVPVDFNALSQEFQQAARARHSPPLMHRTPGPVQHSEQPLAWPADEAFSRRDSSASMLAHSMSNVGLHTPQPHQGAGEFKSPCPPSSIAQRRQRPRPANLGLASLRSASYSGVMAPGSPGRHTPGHSLTPGQPLRRIQSSNVMNGIVNGRVQKPSVAPPQRSPLNWTFSDAMNSPKVARHVSNQSTGSLAPPTPLSPNEFPRMDPPKQFQSWQTASGHVSRQASISENDTLYSVPVVPNTTAPQHFTSPPSTPAFQTQQQQFMQSRFGTNVITENTPPQSAPASQQCFPANSFAGPQQQMQLQQHHQHQHHQHHQNMQPLPQQMHQAQPFLPSQPQQYVHAMMPEQHFQPQMTFPPQQHFSMTTSGPPMEMPLQFAPVPIVNAEGELQIAMPSQIPFAQYQQMQTPPQMQHPFVTTASPSPGMHITAQLPKQQAQPSTEFFVHEYSPPQDIKRSATPRKAVDSGPKNYTFANQGPEHFEKNNGKKAVAASSSPGSS